MELGTVSNRKEYSKVRDLIENGMNSLAGKEDSYYAFRGEKNLNFGCPSCTYIGRLEYPTSFHHLDDEVTVIVAPRTLPLGDKGFGVGYDINLSYGELGYSDVSGMIADMKEHPEEFFSVSLDEAYAEAGATNEATKAQAKQKFMKTLDLEGLEKGFDDELAKLMADIEGIILPAIKAANGNK